jgi:fucose permease
VNTKRILNPKDPELLARRSGLSILGHHNVKRPIAVTSTVIRLKSRHCDPMQFSILNAIWVTLYVAIALASFRYPSDALVTATEAVCGLTFAGVAVIAFDRRSTPLFVFVVFGLAVTFASGILMAAIFPVMKILGTTTGSNEYNYLSSLLLYHAAVGFGVAGYFFGVFVAARGRRATADTATKLTNG